MEEIARVYADALFRAAKAAGKLDVLKEQLSAFTASLRENREMELFFFSPYFSSAEKRDGLGKALDGAEPELANFLELLAEKHRMPAIFRIRDRFDDLWAEANRRLEVIVTSAVELDPKLVANVGAEIERQTNRKIDLRSEVDESILGGLRLRVGNMVLDASLHNQLERLRKEVAQAA